MAIFSAVTTFRGQEEGLSTSWIFDAKAPVYSDIVCADINGDGKKEILFKVDSEELFCLTAEGKRLWSYALGGESAIESMFLDKSTVKIVCSNPVVADVNDDGLLEVVVGGANGTLYCLDKDGKKLWEFKAGGPIHSTPVVADINGDGKPEVMFGSSDHCLYALDSTGKRLWSFETGLEIESGIAVADINKDGKMEIVFGSNDNKIYALNGEGDLVWNFLTTGAINATPRFGDIHNNGQTKVVIGSNDGFVYVIKANGNLEWKYKTNGRIVSEVSLADLNSDNKLEIVVTSCSYEENVIVLSNMRDKIASYGAGFWVTSSTIVDDINKDGNYEIVFGSYDHHVHMLTFKREPLEFFQGAIEPAAKLFDAGSIVVGTPCFTNDQEPRIIAATDQGKVIALRI